MANIHPSAIIDSTARIAPSARIGPYCVIGPEVIIGADTILHNHVVVHKLTTIGNGNQFFPFSVLGADPQDKKFMGERTTCVIGDRNVIREHVTVHRGTGNDIGVTVLGSDNLIMVAAHIAHDSVIGDHVCIANQVMIAGHVRIRDCANIGGGAGVHHFTTIGTCAFVGGLARIAKDVPPYMIVEGNPAEVRGINSLVMARRGFHPDHVEAMKDAYKRLYRDNGAPMSEKTVQLLHDYPDVPAVRELCSALDESSKGLHGRALELRRHDDKRTVAATH